MNLRRKYNKDIRSRVSHMNKQKTKMKFPRMTRKKNKKCLFTDFKSLDIIHLTIQFFPIGGFN